MEFIIDRSKWRCGDTSSGNYTPKYGKGKGITSLLNDQGFMCCLGQTMSQCGVSDNDLLNLGEPFEVNCYGENPFLYLSDEETLENTELSDRAICINDSEYLTTKERERQLKKLFKEYGHTIKFINKTVSNK